MQVEVEERPQYQQRVYDDLSQNQTRYNELTQFIDSSAFTGLSFRDQKLQIQQQMLLKALINVLLERIKLF